MKKVELEKLKGKKITGGYGTPAGQGAAAALGKREQRERERQRLLQKRLKSK